MCGEPFLADHVLINGEPIGVQRSASVVSQVSAAQVKFAANASAVQADPACPEAVAEFQVAGGAQLAGCECGHLAAGKTDRRRSGLGKVDPLVDVAVAAGAAGMRGRGLPGRAPR